MLKKYMIERNIVNAGAMQPESLCGVAQTSRNALKTLGTGIQWLESFVAQDKVYCVFLAEDPSLIREHARLTGFPANAIEEIRSMIDPSMAPA